jgi:ubiquinol-cytochrome c reductase cytochrome b subunit
LLGRRTRHVRDDVLARAATHRNEEDDARGAIRLFPPYLHIGRYGVPEVFWPAIALPALTFMLLYAWPFIERRVTHDRAEHHLLDRPRERPLRTAIGVGVLSFYIVLLVAGGQDLIAQRLGVSILVITRSL